MAWLISNWTFLVVLGCIIGLGLYYIKKFSGLPSVEQLDKVREWLLYAVIEAEKCYQSGTGALKLRATYNEFCQVFPNLVAVVSFELFSKMVDDALVEMKKILESNKSIEQYVKGE